MNSLVLGAIKREYLNSSVAVVLGLTPGCERVCDCDCVCVCDCDCDCDGVCVHVCVCDCDGVCVCSENQRENKKRFSKKLCVAVVSLAIVHKSLGISPSFTPPLFPSIPPSTTLTSSFHLLFI